MAKEDFCFTYYDGDAARDMTHMTRLQRGCYTDIIISIRKFGHLTIDQIKMILSKDFEECFPAIELILKKDAEGKYFLEWLENSLQKSKKHAQKQRNNRAGKTKQQPNNNQHNNLVEPLEDGNGYEDEEEKKDDEGTGEEEKKPAESFFLNELDKTIELSHMQVGATIEFLKIKTGKDFSADKIAQEWKAFKILEFDKKKFYTCFEDLLSHFRNSIKFQNIHNGGNKNFRNNHARTTESFGAGTGGI